MRFRHHDRRRFTRTDGRHAALDSISHQLVVQSIPLFQILKVKLWKIKSSLEFFAHWYLPGLSRESLCRTRPTRQTKNASLHRYPRSLSQILSPGSSAMTLKAIWPISFRRVTIGSQPRHSRSLRRASAKTAASILQKTDIWSILSRAAKQNRSKPMSPR